MEEEELTQQLESISASTATLLDVISELKDVTSTRLDNIENKLDMATRQSQQSVVLLTELTHSTTNAE